jgi:hypothetical protein
MKSLIPTRIAFTFLMSIVLSVPFSASAQDPYSCPPEIEFPDSGLFLYHYYTDNTNNNTNWIEDPALNNNISLSNNELTVDDVYGMQTHRVYRNANTLYGNPGSDLYNYSRKFRADFKVRILGGECPSHLIFGLSTGSADFTVGGTASEIRAIGVLLTTKEGDEEPLTSASCLTNGNNIWYPNPDCAEITAEVNPWRFRLITRAGNGATMFDVHKDEPDHITVPALNEDYYVRLIRSEGDLCLSVYSDAAFTQHVPGSPDCFTNILFTETEQDELEDRYYFIQHGGRRASTSCRHASYTIDDLKMYNWNSAGFDCNLRKSVPQHPSFSVHPNPTTGQVMIDGLTEADNIERIRIFDVNGTLCKTIHTVTSSAIDMSAFENGLYIIEITTQEKNYQSKIVLDK